MSFFMLSVDFNIGFAEDSFSRLFSYATYAFLRVSMEGITEWGNIKVEQYGFIDLFGKLNKC